MKKILIVSCFDWYQKRLKYIEKFFLDKGIEVEIITSDFDHIKKKKIENKISNQKYFNVIPYKKNLSISRLYSHYKFAKDVGKYIEYNNPDIIYSLVPPNSLVKKISNIKKKKKFKLVYDIIDMWPESFPTSNKLFDIPFKIWRDFRDKNINVADMIVLECNAYKTFFKGNVEEKKMHTFYLTKSDGYENFSFDDVKYMEDSVVLAYLGSINKLIDIDEICNVIQKIQLYKKVIVKIIGKGYMEEIFIRRLEELGVTVFFYGEVFEEERKKELFQDCHFGLNIYKTNTVIGLTIKSIDYFQLGLPILNSIGNDTEDFVKEYDIGINISDLSIDGILNYVNDINRFKVKVRKFYFDKFDDINVRERIKFLEELV